jgi:hypothetical protein
MCKSNQKTIMITQVNGLYQIKIPYDFHDLSIYLRDVYSVKIQCILGIIDVQCESDLTLIQNQLITAIFFSERKEAYKLDVWHHHKQASIQYTNDSIIFTGQGYLVIDSSKQARDLVTIDGSEIGLIKYKSLDTPVVAKGLFLLPKEENLPLHEYYERQEKYYQYQTKVDHELFFPPTEQEVHTRPELYPYFLQTLIEMICSGF